MERLTGSRISPGRTALGDATQRVNNGVVGPTTALSKEQNRGLIDTKYDIESKQRPQPQGNARQAPNVADAQRENQHSGHATADDIPKNQGLAAFSTESHSMHRLSGYSERQEDGKSERIVKTHVGPWRLGRTLGKGSSARVREAKHCVTNQMAAVKIVPKKSAHLSQAGSLARLHSIDSNQPEVVNGVRRMPLTVEREIAIMKLVEHPNIIKLYDIWENRSEIYMVLEFAEGGDLFHTINRSGPLPEEEAIFYFRQIMVAIQHCHSYNICHRDLKPENILMEGTKVRVADFGMAALRQAPGHLLLTACGSPHYAAPELVRGVHYRGEDADVWSMGVVLYAMLSATLPFHDDDGVEDMLERIKRGVFRMPKNITREAKDMLARILQTNPKNRITLPQMWKHPLIRKYDYFNDLGPEGNKALDVRGSLRLGPIMAHDIDMQLLRQMQSMWHAFSEKQLMKLLMIDLPNDQKLFYTLLNNYRERQMENYNPSSIIYSKSDFHHLRGPNWKKRTHTFKFNEPAIDKQAQIRASKSSEFTVVSAVVSKGLREENRIAGADTVRSFDPYNASLVMRGASKASHAKVTIHRNPSKNAGGGDAPAASDSFKSHRSTANSSHRRKQQSGKPQAAAGIVGNLKSPLGSMTSIQSSTQGAPQLRTNSRYRRGVNFSRSREQRNSERPAPRNGSHTSLKAPASIAGDETTYDRDYLSPSSPRKKRPVSRRRPAAAQPAVSAADAKDQLWNEELQKFSSTIAKDCDNAFMSSILSEDTDGNHPESSPLSFSLLTPISDCRAAPSANASGMQATAKNWDSRPLPPTPPEESMTPEPMLYKDKRAAGRVDGIISGLQRITNPGSSSRTADRRHVSAPVYVQYGRTERPLPSIVERYTPEGSAKPRIVSAPTERSAGLPTPHENRGIEYLAQADNTIRVVNSPTAVSKAASSVQAPRPLNVRKKNAHEVEGTPGRAYPSRLNLHDEILQQKRTSASSTKLPAFGEALDTSKNKKSSWFSRRSSKDNVSDSGFITVDSRDEVNLHGAEPHRTTSQSSFNAASAPAAAKKKGFPFLFWKGGKTEAPRMSLANNTDTPSPEPGADAESSIWYDESEESRKIDVHQSWIARLFHVKPATRYLCFAITRRQARHEITALLKDWRKYGIKDIEVDKEHDIVFARVGAKNYLNMKEVAFAIEVMTVIEHGKRNHLSLVRVTQERGAASSLHKVMDTMESIFSDRHLLVANKTKAKMMVKTLTCGVTKTTDW